MAERNLSMHVGACQELLPKRNIPAESTIGVCVLYTIIFSSSGDTFHSINPHIILGLSGHKSLFNMAALQISQRSTARQQPCSLVLHVSLHATQEIEFSRDSRFSRLYRF
jgi:hypothetical protein